MKALIAENTANQNAVAFSNKAATKDGKGKRMESKNSMIGNFASRFGKAKSDDEIARTKLGRETGTSVWFVGAMWCGLIAFVTFSIGTASSASLSTRIILRIVSVILIVLTIVCAIKHIKRKNALEDVFESVLGGERSIINISATSGLSEREVIRIIQSLLSKGILKNVYIDKLNRKIIEKQKNADKSNNVGKVVQCSGCGAKNTLNGTVGQQCEYCGAVLHEN